MIDLLNFMSKNNPKKNSKNSNSKKDNKKVSKSKSLPKAILTVEECREIVASMTKAESLFISLSEEMTILEKEAIFWCSEIENIERDANTIEQESFLPDYNEKMEEILKRMEAALKRLDFENKNLDKFKAKYNRAAKEFGFQIIL